MTTRRHEPFVRLGDAVGSAKAGQQTPTGYYNVERMLKGVLGRKAGFGAGDFYAEPSPKVRMRRPGRMWHAGKVLFEKQVLWQWL